MRRSTATLGMVVLGAMLAISPTKPSMAGWGRILPKPIPATPFLPTLAPPEPVHAVDSSVAYCEGRFHSYDPASGTYLGYDGLRHSCS
jgi:hypothetical protein